MAFALDPSAFLDFAEDWSAWLADGETITSFSCVNTDSNVTVASSPAPSQTGGVVTCWLTGGVLNTTARVVFHIETSQGRQDDRTIFLNVQDR